MGTPYGYTCPGCGYAASVSGGYDVGEASATVTITCATCAELDDAVVSLAPWKEPPDPVPASPRCPKARGKKAHDTRLWTGDECPKCGATMERDGLRVLWD